MKIDTYTKIVLTVIAICLIINVLEPLFISEKVSAYNDITLYGSVYEDVKQAISLSSDTISDGVWWGISLSQPIEISISD